MENNTEDVNGDTAVEGSPTGHTISRVGVVGSGIMGSGIAEVIAKAGFEVVLRSRKPESGRAMLDQLATSLAKQVDKGRLESDERDAVAARVTTCTDIKDLADCGLVIESVVENLAVKKDLFTELDEHLAPDALIVTNTSTLPVVEMAMATNRPDRVCGLHFFNPAPVMSLVEIIEPLTASAETMQAVRDFALACGKQPVDVQDRAGFIVNALLFPYLNNAARMLERGIATREDIDLALQAGCNFPMGPLALLDLVGLDTSVAILDALYTEYADPNYVPVPSLRRMVAAGQLGRKSGRGFYDYSR